MKKPVYGKGVFIADGAQVVGDVTLEEDCSVWYNAVIRGDQSPIRIGKRTNIQDGCILHVDQKHPMILGDDVVVGHGAILHSCTVEEHTLIGMGSIILNEAKIGRDCIIGAGALVTGGVVIPPRSLVVGSPAKVKRELTQEEIDSINVNLTEYLRLKEEHRKLSEDC